MNQVARTDSAPESPPAHSKGSSDRYPGPRSFDDNDVDRRLFFGRETEIDYLLHLVRATRMLVLFGKSGLGKTSLLQAGLYPRLREVALLPVPIRFNERGFNERDIRAREVVFAAVKVACETNEIDYVPASPDGLWEFFKTTDFWRDDVLVTPVLVFDQFEEIFTLQPDPVRQALAAELGELVGRGLPTRIRRKIQPGDGARYSDNPPGVKVILSLREEYVGALEQVVPNMPAIFDNDFDLRLSTKSAPAARS